MWRANGNLNPCMDPDKILLAHLHVSKKGFDSGLTHPLPSLPCEWGLETLRAEGQIFENCLQNKRLSASCQ